MMNTRHASESIKKRQRRECKCSLHSPNDSRTHDVKTGRKCPKNLLTDQLKRVISLSREDLFARNAWIVMTVTYTMQGRLTVVSVHQSMKSPLSLLSTDNEAKETNSGINPEHID